MAEKTAAKKEGSRKLKSALLESMIPFLFNLYRTASWNNPHISPTTVPIAKAAPGL